MVTGSPETEFEPHVPGHLKDGKDRIKILAYRGDRSSCWFYRLHSPLGHFARRNKDTYEVSISGVVDKRHFGQSRLIILQRQYKDDVLAPILQMKRMGAKLVYEVDDDLFNIPEWNSAKHIIGVQSVQKGIKRFLENVDAMFVSTEYLREVYKNYCKKIYVLPNSIDFEFFTPSTRNSKKPVVTWQGSMTHKKDIGIALDGIAEIAKNPNVCFKLWCGYDLKTHKPIFDVPGAHVIPLVPFEAFYPTFSLLDADVGLAPLAFIPFNRSKSNLKFLEYTAQGVATVASDFGPYQTIENEVTGLLVTDNRQWYDAVMYLVENPDARSRLLQNATEFVKNNYDMSKNYIYWENAIKEILGDKT